MTQDEQETYIEKCVHDFEEYPDLHPVSCDLWNENAYDQDKYGRICTCGLTEAMIKSLNLKFLNNYINKEEIILKLNSILKDDNVQARPGELVDTKLMVRKYARQIHLIHNLIEELK